MKNATPDATTILGLVIRTFLASVAGGLITSGNFSPEDLETVTGGVTLLAVGAWSWLQKRRAAKKLLAAIKAPAVYN